MALLEKTAGYRMNGKKFFKAAFIMLVMIFSLAPYLIWLVISLVFLCFCHATIKSCEKPLTFHVVLIFSHLFCEIKPCCKNQLVFGINCVIFFHLNRIYCAGYDFSLAPVGHIVLITFSNLLCKQ